MTESQTVPDLGPLEFKLLKVLWQRSPASAREVKEMYNDATQSDLKYTTIMTLLTRMVDKGVVSVNRKRHPFRFSPRVDREAMLSDRVRDFVDRFFEGHALDLAVRLVEENALSEEAIKRLGAMLDQRRASAEDQEEC